MKGHLLSREAPAEAASTSISILTKMSADSAERKQGAILCSQVAICPKADSDDGQRETRANHNSCGHEANISD